MRIDAAMVMASVLALGACGDATPPMDDMSAAGNMHRQQTPVPPMVRPSAGTLPIATPDPATSPLRSCAAELGVVAARLRADVCRDVSPATHPPCNVANSCAMIEDEIARSCALFAGDGAPMKGCGPDPTGSQAAADVVRRYYSAIDARDYPTAWTQWGDDGRPGRTLAAFAHGFARTRSTRVTIGALQPSEGGAGSIYQIVPVTIEATLDDGTRQRFAGTYVVRRVNGVDGASASQLRWHIDAAKLKSMSVK